MGMTLLIIGVFLLGGATAFLSMKTALNKQYAVKFKQQQAAAIKVLHAYKKRLTAGQS